MWALSSPLTETSVVSLTDPNCVLLDLTMTFPRLLCLIRTAVVTSASVGLVLKVLIMIAVVHGNLVRNRCTIRLWTTLVIRNCLS